MVFPTKVFLQIVDLPAEDTDNFVGWVEDVFGGLGNPAGEAAMNAAFEAHPALLHGLHGGVARQPAATLRTTSSAGC